MVIYLVSLLPARSNGLPRGISEADRFIPPYLAFLPVGFAMPLMSPSERWALTLSRYLSPCFNQGERPRHFTLIPSKRWNGIFSVALSFPSPGLRVTEHCVLWSSDFPPVPSIRKNSQDRRPPRLLNLQLILHYHPQGIKSDRSCDKSLCLCLT